MAKQTDAEATCSKAAPSSSSEKSPLPVPTFEDLLNSIDDFGLYQKLLCLGLIGLSTFTCVMTFYAQVIFLLTPPYHCVAGGGGSEDNCLVNRTMSPDNNWTVTLDSNWTVSGGTNWTVFGREPEPCARWRYDTGTLFHTIPSENDWVCNDSWKPFVIHAVFWVGNIIGSWVWGVISDKLGRKPATLASFAVYSVFGALTLVKPSNLIVLSIIRFMVGTAHHTISHLPYVLVIEYCGARARVYPLLALVGAWGLGGAVLPWIAYAAWNWRILVLASSLPLLLSLPFYRYIPESASWLMVHGHGDAAAALMRQMARVNGRTLDEHAFSEVMVDITSKDTDKEAQSVLMVRKHPRLMKNMALVTLLWMVACLCFYGHSQNTGNLGSSIFISFSVGALMDLVGMLVPFIINSLGRKWPMCGFFVSSGVCGIAYAMFAQGLPPTVGLVLGLLGRMLMMGAYSTCLQYGPELFPTVIRGQSLALYETMGGVAIFLSPSIVYLHENTPGLPLLVIGALSLVGGAITLFLPETGGANLPQTLVDGEAMGRNQPLLPCCSRDKQQA